MTQIVDIYILRRPRVFPSANYHARTYLKQASSAKSVARDRLTQIFQSVLRDPSTHSDLFILTLPGAWWHFEKNLERRFPARDTGGTYRKVHFTGIESTKQVFQAAAMSMPIGQQGFRVLSDGRVVTNKANYVLINSKVRDYLKVCRKPFRGAWLDYFSPISQDILADIRDVGRLAPKQGPVIFAINVAIGRETKAVTKAMDGLSRDYFLHKEVEKAFGPMTLMQKESYREEGMKISRLQLAFARLAAPLPS